MPAYFRCKLSELFSFSDEQILGHLASGYDEDGFYDLKVDAIASWKEELPLFRKAIGETLQQHTACSDWHLLIEYPIPRIGKRIDAIFICGEILVVVEFKLGCGAVSAAKTQVFDYSLDLRDFHKESWDKKILPIVLAPDHPAAATVNFSNQPIHTVLCVNGNGLKSVLLQISLILPLEAIPINARQWDMCLYTPTPTIVAAAQHLYGQNSVEEIMRSSAGTEALKRTSNVVLEVIQTAKNDKKKVICFVTGVPGSGKTLVGLDVANRESTDAARFMSGNIPLIYVLREALARNLNKLGTSKIDASRLMSDRIQNIHHYTKDHFKDEEQRAPEDGNIIIYDEAQRAWDAAQNKRKNHLNHSEPEMILEVMGRLEWCALIAIIGNGQEINTGEAGIAGWKDALGQHDDWSIYIPDASHSLDIFNQASHLNVSSHKYLHLSISMRSYTAQTLSNWIDFVLDGNAEKAHEASKDLSRYPVRLTRNLNTAKYWLKKQATNVSIDTPLRTGLIASSGAKRLRAHGIDVSTQITETDWFLNDSTDIRSSSFLELAATEYATQGLELDYIGVCWGADFRWSPDGWKYHALSGTRWHDKNKKDNESQIVKRNFMKNTYRVLLSRAREGMIIWVPEGDASDPTRLPKFYDTTSEYLQQCGVQLID
ncbi:MAG: DUF2075 domain-containing protein [Pontiellaceae bacterium]|nr:DUF2075 domain-containing protein [Pontiellaceae bacterium]